MQPIVCNLMMDVAVLIFFSLLFERTKYIGLRISEENINFFLLLSNSIYKAAFVEEVLCRN